jgi:Tfp pilus assembly protein PilF
MSRVRLACVLVLLLPSLALAGDFERGLEALGKKDYDHAIIHFNAYMQANPKQNASAYYNRGLAHYGKKDYDWALADFTESIHLDPRNADAYCNRGSVHYHKKQYDKAIDDFDAALRLNPRHPGASDNRGSAYAAKKDYDKAIAVYQEAIRLNPNRPHAYNNLAWLLATCPQDAVRDGGKAVQLAVKACDFADWRDSNLLDTLAAAYAECQKFAEAVQWQKRAVEIGYEDKEDEAKALRRLKLYEEGKPYRQD